LLPFAEFVTETLQRYNGALSDEGRTVGIIGGLLK
jgi:hypothetical protein